MATRTKIGTARTVASSTLRPGLLVKPEATHGTGPAPDLLRRVAIDPRAASTGTDLFDVPGYERLAGVLIRAYAQAAEGKGAERHAQGQPFHAQPMQQLIQLYGVGFALGQAAKKAQEAPRLPTVERQVAELLGAINYLAGAVIALEAGQSTTTTKD